MPNFKRFPIWFNNVSFVNFQYMQHMAEPWAIPVYWHWELEQGIGTPPGPEWRKRGWCEPNFRLGRRSVYTKLFFRQDPTEYYVLGWDSERLSDTQTLWKPEVAKGLFTPVFGTLDTTHYVGTVGDTSPPQWATSALAQIVLDVRPPLTIFGWRFYPHSECWVPDFPR